MCVTQLQRAGKLPNELTQAQQVWASRLAALFQEKLHAASEIVPLTELYFTEEPPVISGEATEVLAEEQVPTVISAFITELNALPDDFEAQDVKKALKTVQKSTGFKGKQLFMPIRAKITGEVHGADLNESIVLLGKDRVLRWLQA
jgi:nondiscriminating glutamyl-tRNA synthetase